MPSIDYVDAQLGCMAVAMYHEAHTESEKAQKAVGAVILNRVKEGSFGKDACSVVFAKGQFLGVHDETHDEATTEDYLKTKLIAWKYVFGLWQYVLFRIQSLTY